MKVLEFIQARHQEAPELVMGLLNEAHTHLRCPKCGKPIEDWSQFKEDAVSVIHSKRGEPLSYCYMDAAWWEKEEARVLRPVAATFHGHADFNPQWSLT